MERAFMTEGGVDSADFLKFMGEDSGNVAESGLFSIQVASPNQQITCQCQALSAGCMLPEAALERCSRILQSCPHQHHLTATCREACQLNTSPKHCVSQVLSKALEVWDLQCIPQEAPDMATARQHPEREQAFICNLQVGWPAGL